MDIFDLLSESQRQNEQVQNELNKLRSVHAEADWVNRVNRMLNHLSPEQVELLRRKFRNIKNPNLQSNIGQRINGLVEILVAEEYWYDKPCFFNDNSGNPDIYLKKTKQWIEVKCLNNSDYEKDFNEPEHDIITPRIRIGPAVSLRKEDDDHYKNWSHKKLFDESNKNPGLVCKAVRQLTNHDGFLYFVYNIDFALSWVSSDIISKRIEEDVKTYCRSKKVMVITKKFFDLLK